MNDDLDWTWRLGEAVVAQQTDVIKAIEEFRDRAYAAGNLKSDDFQNVTEEDGAIQITPVEDDVIYVPYYEPERVVVYQPRPVYYYYPRPYPLYYYPYPAGYAFDYGYFWGVTTAFHIGWFSHDLRIWHPSYYGHPYYGYTYWNNWWYRRPDIHVYNNYYVRNPYNVSRDRYRRGDYWQPQTRRTVRSSDQRLTRTRYYPNVNRQSTSTSATTRSPATSRVRSSTKYTDVPKNQASEPKPTIRFRDREGTATSNRGARTVKPSTATSSSARQSSRMLARQSEPAPTYTRPTQPKTTYTRPTQPRQSYSRPSQPKASSSRAVQPRQSSAPRSKSAPSNSASNKRASASSSRNTSRKR